MRRAAIRAFSACSALLVLAVAAAPAMADTWTVTRTDDAVDGTCSPVDCGLREAFDAANATPGNDTIVIPAGTFVLTGASIENGNASGDLDLTGADDNIITGAGDGLTFIQATSGDRAIDHTGSGDLTLSGVTIMAGSPSNDDGGGLKTTTNGDLVISDTRFTANHIAGASGSGGGIFAAVSGTLRLTNVEVDGNSALGDGGGALLSGQQGLVIDGSLFHGNTTSTTAAGAWVSTQIATPTVIRNSVFHANRADGSGSALSSTSAGPLRLRNVTISGNVANDDEIGGGTGSMFAQGTEFDLGNTLVVDNVQKPNGGGPTSVSVCNAFGIGSFTNTGGNVFDAVSGLGCGPFATSTIDATLDGGTFGAFGGTGLFQVPIAGDEAAFDAGVTALCTEAGATDGRGAPRTVGASCDAGAYELGGLANMAATLAATPTALTQGTASSTSGTFQNLGPDVAVNARIELAIPAGATAVTPTAPVGGSCVVGATKVTCTVPLLNVNDTLTASTTFTPASGGAFTLRTTAASGGSDTTPANDSASRDVTITALPPTDPTPTNPNPTQPDPTASVSPRVTFATTATGQPVRVGRTGTFAVRLTCPTGVSGVRRARTFAVTCTQRSIPAGTTATVTCTVPAAVRTALRDRVVALRMTARSTASSGGASVTRTGVVRIRTRA
jgi:hypothetical protein